MRNLKPKAVWSFFNDITQIPRPSKKEERILAYLVNFANQHQLTIKSDDAGNLLISKPATNGYETKATIILQSHVDMVCEKNSDVTHNFETDAIQTYIDGDWIKAKGTTLGADNGIGMAMMLAVLASEDLQHPAIECLFTVDEETGLTGAFALGKNFLSGEKLINLDSEDNGEIFVGCAGGIGTTAQFKYEQTEAPWGYFAFRVKISGLKGGHSGDDINKGLGNSIKILNRYLWNVNQKMDLRLIEIEGGNLHNAIPREASAFACVPYKEKETVRVLLNILIADVENEIKTSEPGIRFEMDSDKLPEKVIDKKTSDALLNALYACPHGVKAMSKDMHGLVETSTNLASIKMKDNHLIEIVTSQRSSVESAKIDIASQVEAVFLLAGASVSHTDGYPGWKPNLNSEVLKVAQKSYQNLYGEEPKIKAIHAGLECGLFLEKYPQLDMISIGPTMRGVHSPDERLSIASTQQTWEWLKSILAS